MLHPFLAERSCWYFSYVNLQSLLFFFFYFYSLLLVSCWYLLFSGAGVSIPEQAGWKSCSLSCRVKGQKDNPQGQTDMPQQTKNKSSRRHFTLIPENLQHKPELWPTCAWLRRSLFPPVLPLRGFFSRPVSEGFSGQRPQCNKQSE